MSLKDEIKQSKPFSTTAEEATLNIVRTAEYLRSVFAEELKPYGITGTQYNVLRILRGAGPEGCPCGQIADRMVTQDSDITRLLDRLSGMGLISRGRCQKDRRVVTTVISAEGKKLLNLLDPVVQELNQSLLGHLDERTLATMIRGLEQIREHSAIPA